MSNSIAFYNNCMSNSSIQVGFAAEKVAMAGNSIEGLGNVFLWAGDMFTKYGWSGSMLSTFGLGIGKVAQLRGGGDGVYNLAKSRIVETGGAFGVGVGLAAIGGPVGASGRFLASRHTQCTIANAFEKSWFPQQNDL